MDDLSLVRRRRDAGNAPQQQRVVGEQQLGTDRDRLGGGLRDTVDGEQDPTHVGVRVAEHQTDPVPRFRPVRLVAPFEQLDDIRDTHGVTLPDAVLSGPLGARVQALLQRLERKVPGERVQVLDALAGWVQRDDIVAEEHGDTP
jgi:hypothetical protein